MATAFKETFRGLLADADLHELLTVTGLNLTVVGAKPALPVLYLVHGLAPFANPVRRDTSFQPMYRRKTRVQTQFQRV
jgi:hypothetical protein